VKVNSLLFVNALHASTEKLSLLQLNMKEMGRNI
jgi:hypothetical protein